MPSHFPTNTAHFYDLFRDKSLVPDYVSSGSEHGGDAELDGADDSLCLSQLVYGFLVDEADTRPVDDGSDSDRDSSVDDSNLSIEDLSRSAVQRDGDSYRNMLYGRVLEGMEVFSCLNSNKPLLRRNVMSYLRNLGYNAAVCKTKWESSGGLAAGNYEFIDVIRSDSSDRLTRYFVDLDFAAEFEIARPTALYRRLLQSTPRVFVGRVEELKRNLKVLSDAARRSLKSREIHLPPWRKHRYMQNKWLGQQYKRTPNVYPAKSPVLAPPPSKNELAVKCRAIGFETTDRFVLPAATRSR